MTLRHVALVTAASLGAMPGVALAQAADEAADEIPASFRLSTGLTYSSGSYGEIEDTEVLAVPLSLTYSDNGFKFRISIPYVMIDGPGSLLSTPEGRDNFGGDDRIGSSTDSRAALHTRITQTLARKRYRASICNFTRRSGNISSGRSGRRKDTSNAWRVD